MKTIKRILLFCLLGLAAISASAKVLSGNCGIDGDNVTWSLDTDSGVLVISGKGAMDNYNLSDHYPTWYYYTERIYIVDINEGVSSIGSGAFGYCSSLTSITIPNSVTSIGGSAFSDCSSLTSITIPNSVTYIEQDAFSGCSNLSDVTFEIVDWENQRNIVSSFVNRVYSVFRGKTFHYSYNGKKLEGEIEIPGTGDQIVDYALYRCEDITGVVIPNSVTSIGGCAFSGCSSLTSITIPNSVTSIGGGAFSDCSSLTSITIPNSVTSIGNTAFYGCSSLTSITIPNSVTSIGSRAFSDCSSLTSITIPNSVTSIGESAFSGCSSLTSITIPNSVTDIGQFALRGCSSLTSITIPNSVTSIGKYAFSDCSSLTSITIPNSVTSIGEYAFDGCSSLTSIAIEIADWGNPNHVATSSALNGKTLYYLYDGKKLEGEIEIPSSVTQIGDNALYNCEDVTSLVIPISVTSIGDGAFKGCSSLESVKVGWYLPLNVGNVFDYNDNRILSRLYVPKGSIKFYQSVAVWKDFYDIQEYDEEGEGETYLLTFKTEGGKFVQSVEVGKSLDISIVPDAGWEIHSATFNGMDITHQLTGAPYSTPVIKEDSELNVVFRQKDNRVGAVAPTDVKVRAWAGTIHVSGADERADVVVYDASGVVVKAAQGNGPIPLDAEGVFIIKVDGETFKVRM